MKLIVGLGNPGLDYEHTRHNVGFDVVDILAEDFNELQGGEKAVLSDFNVEINKSGFKGLYCKFTFDGETVYILKPMTYMNLSGESVKAFVDYYHINIQDIVVVSDDLALLPGSLRLRENGSSGGHNGLKSIINCLGTQEFKRIRIGVGEPKNDVVDYVLGKPQGEDKEKIEEIYDRAVKAIENYIKEGNFNKTASLFNVKVNK